MTENEKHDNLVKHVSDLCQILNTNGIKSKFWDSRLKKYEYSDWRVDESSPESTFLGGIGNDKEAFMFLKRRGEIDRNICWDCGAQPIQNLHTFTDGSDSSIKFFICKDCYLRGLRLSGALRGNSTSKCFIATVCYQDEDALEVNALRCFRDSLLVNNFLGLQLIRFYYTISPSASKWLIKKPLLVKVIKVLILDQIVKHLPKARTSSIHRNGKFC
ncbi:MAG TPA: CFI-box-CTERM domain-containing protein [Bacteroidales bacterium]|nr:CFI-box-CTERM domain-containing protein [Bacteroidales bacterium]HZK23557.1 CFI-box-CTERM domain-containing protein [Atopostipes sp.]